MASRIILIFLFFNLTGCSKHQERVSGKEARNQYPTPREQLAWIREQIKEDPENPELIRRYTEITLDHCQDDQLFRESLSFLATVNNSGPGLLLTESLRDFHNRNFEGAIRKILQYQVHHTTDPAVEYLLVVYYLAQGDYETAQQELSRLQLLQPEKSIYYFLEGEIFLHNKDTGRAIEYFHLCLDKDPDHPEAYQYLMDIYRIKNETPELISLVEKQLEYSGHNELKPILAGLYLERNLYERARPLLLEMESLDSILAWELLSKYYLQYPKYDSAIYYSRKLTQYHPELVQPYLDLGWAYDKRYLYNESLYFYRQALEKDSSNIFAKTEIPKLLRKIAYLQKIKEEFENRPVIEPLKPIKRSN